MTSRFRCARVRQYGKGGGQGNGTIPKLLDRRAVLGGGGGIWRVLEKGIGDSNGTHRPSILSSFAAAELLLPPFFPMRN